MFRLSALRNEPVLEEILANRALIIASEDIVDKAELPLLLTERCTKFDVFSWGCFMNDALLSNQATKQLLVKMRPTADRDGHYERISALLATNWDAPAGTTGLAAMNAGASRRQVEEAGCGRGMGRRCGCAPSCRLQRDATTG